MRTINVRSRSAPLPKKWRACVGAGEALDGLRADWQRQFSMAVRNSAFEHARLSGWRQLDARCSREIDALCDFLSDHNISPVMRLDARETGDSSSEGLDTFARHVIARYGANRTHKWRFEIPFNRRFASRTDALKHVDPGLNVGALISAEKLRKSPIDSRETPSDFIVISGETDSAARVSKLLDALDPSIPVHWDGIRKAHTAADGLKDAIALTQRFMASDSQFDSMALASFSGLCGAGAYLIDDWGVAQPTAHAYRMMDTLGGEEIARGPSWIITRDAQDRVVALAWYDPAAPTLLDIANMRPYTRIMLETVDRDHGWAFPVWQQMGHPESLARHQVQALRQASQMTCVAWARTNETGSFKLELPRTESIILLKEQ
ncbi:hypothetical protein AGMMS49992_10620 [Clostridia bacterium]|nr:hypothetical protein AGMMS49992_10620 [Clostridia bacterium]